MTAQPVRTVALFVKPGVPEINSLGRHATQWLQTRGIKVRVSSRAVQSLDIEPDGVIGGNDESLKDVDLAMVLGGDGTILWVARKVAHLDIPVLSFNMGTLGFLAAFAINRLYDVLEQVIEGKYVTVNRMMLAASLYRNDKKLHSYRALNDVIVNKREIPRLIELEASLDGEVINTYLCDGLIVSTPTGSTAYSLSAGGPIISPDIEAVAVTPICPHTLTHRPLVISSRSELTIRLLSSDRKALLTLDGQITDSVCCDDVIRISRFDHQARIIIDPDTRFFKILSRKLKWGIR